MDLPYTIKYEVGEFIFYTKGQWAFSLFLREGFPASIHIRGSFDDEQLAAVADDLRTLFPGVEHMESGALPHVRYCRLTPAQEVWLKMVSDN